MGTENLKNEKRIFLPKCLDGLFNPHKNKMGGRITEVNLWRFTDENFVSFEKFPFEIKTIELDENAHIAYFEFYIKRYFIKTERVRYYFSPLREELMWFGENDVLLKDLIYIKYKSPTALDTHVTKFLNAWGNYVEQKHHDAKTLEKLKSLK